jgi:predicted DNA-binding protein
MLTINVSEKLETRFHELAKEIGEDENSLIKKLFFELMEDMEDIHEAQEVLKTYDPKESVVWTLEDLRKEREKLHVEN